MISNILFYFVFFKKFDFDPDPEIDPYPDPELPEKSDPDPEIIFSDPTHCLVSTGTLQFWFKFYKNTNLDAHTGY